MVAGQFYIRIDAEGLSKPDDGIVKVRFDVQHNNRKFGYDHRYHDALFVSHFDQIFEDMKEEMKRCILENTVAKREYPK